MKFRKIRSGSTSLPDKCDLKEDPRINQDDGESPRSSVKGNGALEPLEDSVDAGIREIQLMMDLHFQRHSTESFTKKRKIKSIWRKRSCRGMRGKALTWINNC